jgi:L-seryl-tRNA(Ser) seleniumtransferase
VRTESRVGGGALPTIALPSAAVAVSLRPGAGKLEALEAALRQGDPPVLGRIEAGQLLFDVRTLLPGEIALAAVALSQAAQVLPRNDRSMEKDIPM